ncbi:MAG: hypothetical protein JKY86_07700 [Gammaproteobacteria bacterium]|nr:hypothetical protein [Gammaproteobacteria bacterium]
MPLPERPDDRQDTLLPGHSPDLLKHRDPSMGGGGGRRAEQLVQMYGKHGVERCT